MTKDMPEKDSGDSTNNAKKQTPISFVTPVRERRTLSSVSSSGAGSSVSRALFASDISSLCSCARDPTSASEKLICSICLSPMAPQKAITSNSDFDDEDYDQKLMVETSCKHQFHHECLTRAKLASYASVATCPLCRACLSPSAATRSSRMGDTMRQAVINAAHRGRQAVRMALESRRLAAVMS